MAETLKIPIHWLVFKEMGLKINDIKSEKHNNNFNIIQLIRNLTLHIHEHGSKINILTFPPKF